MYGCPVRLLGFLWARRNLLIKCKRAASLSLDSLPPPPLRSAERGGGPSPSRCNRPRPANNNEIHKSGRGQGTFEVLVDLPCKPREPLFFLLLLFLFLFLRIYSLLRVVHFSSLSLSFFSLFLCRSPSLLLFAFSCPPLPLSHCVPSRECTPCTLSTTSPLLRCLHSLRLRSSPPFLLPFPANSCIIRTLCLASKGRFIILF